MCDLRPLSDALAKKAADELNEKPADNPYYIKALREWVLQQPNLNSRTEDQFLIVFLRASKFSLERAKQKLKAYYNSIYLMPELFYDRDINDPTVMEVLKSGCIYLLPNAISEDGPCVNIMRPKYMNFEVLTFVQIFKVIAMVSELHVFRNDNTVIAGYILIIDFSDVPTSILLNFSPTILKKLIIFGNKTSLARMKGFHFINMPPFVEKIYNTLKSVINPKLINRFHVHSINNLKTLYEHVPQRMLPQEYGGDYDTTNLHEIWWKKLQENKVYLEESNSYGILKDCGISDEDMNTMNEYSLTGTQGSFRKLEID